MFNTQFSELASRAGIVFPGAMDWMPREQIGEDFGPIRDRVAMDAQPSLITTGNAGIPAFLTTYVDPKLIRVLLTPNKAAEIYGEVKKGDWTTTTAMFPMIEVTGEVSTYGDWTENGRSGANVQFPQRQAYLFQTITEWGERELDLMAEARVDWAANLNISSAIALDKAANYYAFFGVSGLQNYGALNDPALPAALTPATKVATGTGWKNALPTEILADIQAMFAQLQIQTGSNLELTDKMTLALHSVSENYLANTNSFGKTAMEMVKTVYPNLRIIQAPQFLSGTTYSCQMFVDEINGQRTIDTAFNERLRVHRIVPAMSSYKQKKTRGTWGSIVYQPFAVVSMSGL
jgi:hypothetical protein